MIEKAFVLRSAVPGKMIADKIQCSKQVYPNDRFGSFHGHQCTITKNIVMRDGKPYCKIHDPVKEAAKQKERQGKWDEENKKEKENYRRQRAMVQACQGVSTEILETIKVEDLICITSRIPGCEGVLNGRKFRIV